MRKFRLRWRTKTTLCLLPSLAGIVFFFVIPYFRVLYYSLIDNQFRRRFVGLDNYIDTLGNEYFQLALKNSLLLIVVAVTLLILIALLVSLALSFGIRKLRVCRAAFVLPMVIPSGSAALVWHSLFSGWDSAAPLYLLFVWKNAGICIVLMTAAFTCIDNAVFESAGIDGAGKFRLHTRITVPMIMPTLLFSVLLSIVNSFKIFRETYHYYGGTNYPPHHSYTLQYYMNNNFLKLDYQSLATAAVLTSLLVFAIVMTGLRLQRRFES
ncbi:MAG: sugar ABC transporter permease [Oscillospiraceae bacterium]|jgi:multiple sugar transport system permease protein|nr:sugar ABC transporter permease [Oscillospiraceae bacterium]